MLTGDHQSFKILRMMTQLVEVLKIPNKCKNLNQIRRFKIERMFQEEGLHWPMVLSSELQIQLEIRQGIQQMTTAEYRRIQIAWMEVEEEILPKEEA
jgi:hypothetical protein